VFTFEFSDFIFEIPNRGYGLLQELNPLVFTQGLMIQLMKPMDGEMEANERKPFVGIGDGDREFGRLH
jgi:hypothetical protein